jgi:hypothetical protein
VKSKTFQLAASDYNRLITGKINFTVNSVQREGDMTIKLNSIYLNVPKVTAGTNIIYFAKTDAVQGANIMEISGSGYWDLGDMTIEI